MEKKNLVGAHVSIAGGIYYSLLRGKDLGANTIQIFTANQRQWTAKKIAKEDVENFLSLKKEVGIQKVLSHTSYLVNLGSPSHLTLEKSKKAFEEEIIRCHELEIDYLVLHPGSYVDSSEDDCINLIIKSLLSFSSLFKKGKTILLLETMSGQGSTVGYKFEQLNFMIKELERHFDIGICLDTCHVFAAGYDIRTKDGFDNTILEFSKKVGLKYLMAFHLNDSKEDLGSKKDRHAPIGDGKIGKDAFKFLMQDKRFEKIPKILETPDENLWQKEIKLLQEFAR